jgi:hypothetical protein
MTRKLADAAADAGDDLPIWTPTTMHSLMHHNHHKAKTNLDQNLNANKLTRATTLTRPPYHQSYLVLPMFW